MVVIEWTFCYNFRQKGVLNSNHFPVHRLAPCRLFERYSTPHKRPRKKILLFVRLKNATRKDNMELTNK